MTSKRLIKVVLFCMILAALVSAGWIPTGASAFPILPNPPKPILTHTVLAKAQPDECFHGIGAPYDPDPTCSSSPGIPKVNQAYVWGLVEQGDNLWFGTAPNVLCSVLAPIGLNTPMQTDSWVCEFGSSTSPAHSDYRVPNIYAYNVSTGTLTDKAPPDPLIARTAGLRSAGTLNGVVLLGGPSYTGGMNLFAYDGATEAYLGSANFPLYNNIRRWVVVDNVLYAGVGKTDGTGAVIRWNGSLTNPFQVEEVGTVDSDAAELIYHQGRLFVNTWPSLAAAVRKPATLWMSPVIPAGGLTAADAATPWTKIFSMDMYDPDPLTALLTGGGAMASYGGYLYWGTMHVPLLSGIQHIKQYNLPTTQQGITQALLGGHRAISIFRAKNLGTPKQKIELLYGEAFMSSYVPGQGWKMLPNKMHAFPLYGSSGFGNFFNNYTWSMTVYNNQLYIGTMDWSYLLREGLPAYLEQANGMPAVDLPVVAAKSYGADLWRFPSASRPAVAESIDGIGNYSSYGIRNLIVGDNALYAGMANPMNLMTDPSGGKPLGGWELIRLAKP